ncbi:MAG TPA: hypothetical protein VF557_15550 [Jatrophihabitans sp.]|jgi:hypothetical protein|uniref:hypothetical protein n=1 Tax=Jatrophihabitans sp. TaxID=1932789 RepID=UPI002F23FB9B
MTEPKKRSKGLTADELMALQEEKLRTDPKYSAEVEAFEAELERRARNLSIAEQPIVRDLRSVGIEVSSVWDLVNTSDPYPEALPVLLEHLKKGGYPDRVMESLGSALAVKPAAYAWETFRELYLSAEGRGEEEGLAVALAASATREHLEELIALLQEDSRSDTRIHFLRPIKRVGGQRGRQMLESLVDDPMFGREARALLKASNRARKT